MDPTRLEAVWALFKVDQLVVVVNMARSCCSWWPAPRLEPSTGPAASHLSSGCIPSPRWRRRAGRAAVDRTDEPAGRAHARRARARSGCSASLSLTRRGPGARGRARALSRARLQVTERVFLDISFGDEPAGRLDIELFGKDAPNAAANFAQLCASGRYAGSNVYRVVSPYNFAGGDIAGGGDGCVKTQACVSALGANGGPFAPDGYAIEHSVGARPRRAGSTATRLAIRRDARRRRALGRRSPRCSVADRAVARAAQAHEQVKVKPPSNKPVVPVRITGSGVYKE